MKRLILASALVSTTALADPVVLSQIVIPPFLYQAWREDKEPVEKDPLTVVATGYGNTCEKALENAKTTAVDTAVGVWINAQRYSKNDSYDEKIVEYSGGLIKSYTIIKNDCTTVKISAEVVPRTNKIKTGSADVSQQARDHLAEKIKNEQKRTVAISEVNNRSKAIAFDIKDIELMPNKMMIVGEVSFQEKWKADYYDLKKQSGNFTLDSFHKPIFVSVKGYNAGKEVFNQKYQLNYNQWQLYDIKDNGNVTIYPNRKDTIKLTFPVVSGKIMDVDKFEVIIL